MFDVIGYWGILTITLMSPIVFALWVFLAQTNWRIKEMGGKEVPLFKKVDDFLDNKFVGLPLLLASAFHLVLAAIWLGKGQGVTTYIGFFSGFSESVAPIAGYVLVFLLAFVVYDFMLKGYVRITKLVDKFEDKDQ